MGARFQGLALGSLSAPGSRSCRLAKRFRMSDIVEQGALEG
jgi:hypothetical protein